MAKFNWRYKRVLLDVFLVIITPVLVINSLSMVSWLLREQQFVEAVIIMVVMWKLADYWIAWVFNR